MSSSLNEGALITYGIDEIVKVFEGVHTLTDMTQAYDPGAASLQRSANQYWKPIQQQAVVKEGWDLTGQQDGVLELSIQGSLGDPTNTYRQLRADDVRDETAYRRAVRADAMRLLGDMEAKGLSTAATYGSFCVTDSAAFGSADFDLWDGLSTCTTRMEDTEFNIDDGVCAFLNPDAYRAGGKNLITSNARFSQNLPDDAYKQNLLQNRVAGFDDVYSHPKLQRVTAQATSLTVNGDQSFAPQATELANNGSPVPFDNRYATIPTNEATTGINVGDKFYIANVFAVSLDEKIQLDYEQTFTVTSVGTNEITVSPRPIALDDAALSDLEKAYANINTTISNGDTIVWLNTAARRSNVVMAKDAMVLASSPIPLNHELFPNLFAEQFQVGPINGIIAFNGNIDDFTGSYRIGLWYDWNIEKPEQIGVLLDAQA